ncbi:MAG: glycosyltransferase [Deltaproteobacteria bacterium]|nr:glycosyltransferase [Deltaproteobacteria bacterium]
MSSALDDLKANYDHVVSIYVKSADRIMFARFRIKHARQMLFHRFYMDWHESRLKRTLLFAEARVCPFNGYLFCVSPRLHRFVSSWSPRSVLLLPPVSDTYFCVPGSKAAGGTVNVTYAGRVDVGKGTDVALEVFRRLAGRSGIKARVCGFAWAHKPQTMQMHETLLADPDIVYESAEFSSWSPRVDEHLRLCLQQTDILLLPYRKLSSTVDTPLLLLEGMANLCAIITPPLGSLHDLYGTSRFNIQSSWNVRSIVELIVGARPQLAAEQLRLQQHNAALQFSATEVGAHFRNLIAGAPGGGGRHAG